MFNKAIYDFFINLAQLYDYLNNHITALFILIDIFIKVLNYLHLSTKIISLCVDFGKKCY